MQWIEKNSTTDPSPHPTTREWAVCWQHPLLWRRWKAVSEGLATLAVWVAAGETHFFPAATRVLQQDSHDWAREEKVNEVDKNFRAH